MQALSDPGLKAGQSVASKEYDLTVKNRTTGMGHMEENMQKETTEETLHSSRTLRDRNGKRVSGAQCDVGRLPKV